MTVRCNVMFEVGTVMGSYYMGTMRVVRREFQRDLEIKEASE